MIKLIKKIIGIDDTAPQHRTNRRNDGTMHVSGLNTTAYQFFTETSEEEREQVLDEVIKGANKDQRAILEKYERKYAGVQ